MNPDKPPIIAILSYNKVDLLQRCLKSIFQKTKHPYEICVVDQASTDGTRNYLRGVKDRVDHLVTDSNLGFVLGNNLVMSRYTDRDIVLLNNDTEVTEGWLQALVDRAYSDETIGIVGAKLIFPNGLLQTAGCEIFSDATGCEIGKNDDPERWIYNRTADRVYCSGACLYLKRVTLEKTGYFDPQFAPAYWEDTDLCFSARKAGLRVVYEPTSVVVHHEGGSFGAPSQRSKSKELQERNKPKFLAKWKKELSGLRKNVYEIPPVEGKEKILVILPFLPLFDRAAGEMRWSLTMRILSERYQVVFLARNGQDGIKYINPLEEQGITVFHTDTEKMKQLGCEARGPLWIDFPEILKSNRFKAVIIGFFHVASQYYMEVREYSPESMLIIDSFDVAFLRERRRAELSGKDADLWHAEEIRRIELDWYRRADMALTVTEEDREVLLKEEPTLQVGISTDIHPIPEFQWKEERKDLVFIGNFKHNPNEDAALFMVNEVLPLIHRELPDVKLYLVGNAPTPAVEKLVGPKVIVTGFVPEIIPYMQDGRVCVVPLRYGAGLKGKVGQAMAAGIPQVSTSIGAEGMGLTHGRDILIADRPADFAREVIRLYTDEGLQRSIVENARALVAEQYGFENAKRYWEEVFDAIDAGRVEKKSEVTKEPAKTGYTHLEKNPDIVPSVSVVIPVYNNLSYTETCWNSVRKNSKIPFELLIVDNGSDEPVQYFAGQNNYRCIRNEKNLGFAGAVNQGIRNTNGEYVAILNNDCIVTPGWLERMIAHIEEDDTIGIVAPLTNYAATEQQIDAKYKNEDALYRFSEDLYRKHKGERREMKKVVGMCMVIPRRVIEEVGLFDTRFGIGNFEDDDYCLRVRLAGYKVVCARDVFLHHEGGVTFKSMNVDYKVQIKKNAEIFSAKWAVLSGGGPVSSTGEKENLAAILFQDGPDVNHARVENILKTLPAGTSVKILCADTKKFQTFEKRGIPLQQIRGDDLYRRIDREIRTAETPEVLVLSSRLQVSGGWVEELFHAVPDTGERGLVVPSCNEGPTEQRITGGCGSSKNAVEKQTGKSAAEHHCEWHSCTDFSPSSILVNRSAFLLCNGLSPEFHSGAVWHDLAVRMNDHERETGCAYGSFVYITPAKDGSRSIDRKEADAVRYLAEAGALFSGGDNEAILRAVEKSLNSMENYTHALHARSLLMAAEGRVGEAEEDLSAIVKINPGYSKAYSDLGCLVFEQGKTDEAESSFLQALQVDPGNREINRNLGDLYLSSGSFEKAIALYEAMVRRNPNDPIVYVDLGEWFERFGDRSGAVDWYRKALEIAPDCAEAKEKLSALDGGSGVERRPEEVPC